MANNHQGQRMHRPPYNVPLPNSQREAAFNDIFGAAPPPGRSQTMTSQSSFHFEPHSRSQTMASQMSEVSGISQCSSQSQQPLLGPNGYPRNPSIGYGQSHQQQQFPTRQQSQHAPYTPQPLPPERRPYPQPIRMNPGYSQGSHGKPPTHRYHQVGPAMNSDTYRSRSMANMPSGYTATPSSATGPSPYRPGSGPPNILSRTTAQGRVVPERHDERAMSLTSYAHDHRDHTQTMSGRVIPHRRKESDSQFSPSSQQHQGRSSTMSATQFSPVSQKARAPSSASTSSSVTAVAPAQVNSSTHRPSVQSSSSSHGSTTIVTTSRRTPLVYPALLSRVADALRDLIHTGDRVKNELTYKNAFLGSEAVGVICCIVGASDRNLALLLGRSLDAQRLFHDVTYEHRLRDSQSEVYQFRSQVDEDRSEVNGVFTLLTECYSPTCTRDTLCYSIACPRRLEQQARQELPQPGLKRQDSRSSLHAEEEKEQKLWIHSVPKEIADTVSEKEKKRQEVICEVIYTERDFVKDLEYLRDFWIKPLRSTNPHNPSPIPEQRREIFIRQVFHNVLEVHSVNSRLADALTKRQEVSDVVDQIGDIFLEYVPMFDPFIKYGANQLYGKNEFEKEKARNLQFAKFVEDVERMKESRKLELNGYLTKPTTRLARYPLLLEAVLKYTADDNPDKQNLRKSIESIREFLTKVNQESGKAENHFNLMQLNEQLIFPAGEHVDLKLTEEGRQLIFKGTLKKTPQESSTDIQAFLFDHALLLVRIKVVNKREQYKVYRKPIPLELLVITQMDEVLPNRGVAKRPSSNLIPGGRPAPPPPRPEPASGRAFPITFQHLGRRGYTIDLYASTLVGRKKWIEYIEAQQTDLRERSSNIYTKTVLCESFFTSGNRINCLVPIDGGTKLLYGTDNGVWVSDRRAKEKDGQKPPLRKVLDITKVEQLEVLEEYSMLLILSDKTVSSFPLEDLMESTDAQVINKRPKKIVGHTNFFKAGVCLGKVLVCCVKSSTLSSTVKVLEPLDSLARSRRQPAWRQLLQGGQESLKPYKEFYIPAESTSIHFLKSKLCVGCAKGFEVVSLETLETQSLLDPADTSLDFVERREGNIRPIAIYRHEGEFLLNYSDFSFFVNRNGWRSRRDWLIAWEGQPTAFALSHGYILAFEPSFIEIRDVKTAALVHIVTGKNIRMLHESTREMIYAYEDEAAGGGDVIASMEFSWARR